MTRRLSFPLLSALFISAAMLFAAPARAAGKKKAAAKPAASKTSTAKDKRAASKQAAPKQKETRASKRERAAEERRGKQADKRGAKNERADKNERAEKNSRSASKRERMAEARREAERRRREAAERARQIAIARAAAAARQRAADQALRDETAANIAKDETTGEDMEVRRAAVEALGNNAGTVVVMNPKTGQVYTVVNQDWGVRRGFKPCSTIKLVTGLAGLSESVIDPVQTVNIGTSTFGLDLTDSLALSNNAYFQRVGGQVGFEKMMRYAREMGLGQPTGINHAFESPGKLPVFKEGWALNRMSSHGDDIEVTAVQLANMTSTIANGGKVLVPHLPRTPQENVKFKREKKGEIELPKDNLRRILPGMIGAVNYGTARRAQDPVQTIAGKTGSCIGQGSWVGLFTSFAPVHDPQLAVAVITRGSAARGKYAAAVAGGVYRRLNHRFAGRQGAQPMLAKELLAPRPKIDPRKAAEVSDEEREDEAATEAVTEAATKDAYVVSEAAAGTELQTEGDANRGLLRRTVKTVPRPANAPATGGSAPAANQSFERPRRVGARP